MQYIMMIGSMSFGVRLEPSTLGRYHPIPLFF